MSQVTVHTCPVNTTTRRHYLLKAVLLAILVLATYAASPAGVPSGIPVAHIEEAKASGTYAVKQCDNSGYANGWVAYNPWGAFSTENSACPGGAGLRWWSQGGLGFAEGMYAQWYVNAPAYTVIQSWTATGRTWDNGMTYVFSKCWDYVGGCNWFVSDPDGAYGQSVSPYGVNTGTGNWIQVSIIAGCWQSGGCVPPWAGRIEATGFTFTMYDTTDPWMDGLQGTIFNGGWVKGSQSLYVSAHDTGGGVRQIGWRLDGGGTQDWYGPACAIQGGYYDALAPCPGQQWKWYTINTANFTDGCHTMTGVGQEVTGMQVTTNGSFCSDNNYPTEPMNLTVGGGDGWQQDSSFDISWDNPNQGNGSPIAAAYYRIDGGAWTLINGANIHELNNLNVGSQGSHNITVWIRDEAGNQSEATAVLKGVKWDDQVSGPSLPEEVNGYLNAEELATKTAKWDPVDQLEVPVSGIAGYAVSFDQNPSGDPGQTITHNGENTLEASFPSNLQEGANYIHVRPISGAGIAGPIRTEQIKVDRIPPSVVSNGVPEGWTKDAVTVSLTASDSYSGIDPLKPGSGLIYSVDGGTPLAAQGSSASVPIYETGAHTVETWAVDVAGNSSEKKTYSVKIDALPPALGFKNVKDPENPAVVKASAVDQHSGFKEGSLYYKLKNGKKWNLMPTTYEASAQELVGEVPDDDLEEDQEVEFLAKGADNAGNEGSSDLDLNGNKYTQTTPIKFGSYFRNGNDSGIVFESPTADAACERAKEKLHNARNRRALGTFTRGKKARRKLSKKARKAQRAMKRACKHLSKKTKKKKKKSKGKKASSASADFAQTFVAKTPKKCKATKKRYRSAKKALKKAKKKGQKSRAKRLRKRVKKWKKRYKRDCKTTKKIKGKYVKVATVAYGGRIWVRGRLVDKSGTGVSGLTLDIATSSLEQGESTRVYKIVGRAKTSKTGEFRYQLPRGTGRFVKAIYQGSKTRRRAESGAIKLFVKGRVSFKIKKRKLRKGKTMKVKGTVSFRGDKVPRGKVVALDWCSRKKKLCTKSGWEQLRTYRVNSKGKYTGKYKFKKAKAKGIVWFRIRTPKTGWSYNRAHSRPVYIKLNMGRKK